MNITINFDMDGTLADFYNVPNWLDFLESSDPTPYKIANPLLSMSQLAKKLNALKRRGYRLAIISWTSKTGTQDFNKETAIAKCNWLKVHLPSVTFDEINIVPYGTPKHLFCNSKNDILFDDEERNRYDWRGVAYDVNNILEILGNL